MLLGPAAARLAASNGDVTLPGMPAAALFAPNEMAGGLSQAVLILVLEVLGLAFIGLLSVASFSVMAQRRLRALGMLSAIGATERNLRLVMIVNGLVVGVVGALAGTAAWPRRLVRLRAHAAAGHRPRGRPGQPALVGDRRRGRVRDRDIGAGVPPPGQGDGRGPGGGRAVRPPRAAEGGAPLRRARRHRVRGRPGLLAFVGGLAGLPGAGGGPGSGLPLLAGLVGVIAGIILLAPLGISVLAAGAVPSAAGRDPDRAA